MRPTDSGTCNPRTVNGLRLRCSVQENSWCWSARILRWETEPFRHRRRSRQHQVMLPRLPPTCGRARYQGLQTRICGETNLGVNTNKKTITISMKRSVLIALSVGLAYAFPAHAQK